ncbi:hypothetical protein FOT72_28020 [Citrobacter amalonaticus]|uniref:Uncharacterized protein n=1 Tax=Citrobacter amalonaticus TaxID=35703 RepID=A0A8I0MRW1_CITAM|nr:hypothetical protein [Citrobacter amalonaticus]
MAAMRSDNLIMTRAPLVGAFAFRRYDRGIREVLCINTPVISSKINHWPLRKPGLSAVKMGGWWVLAHPASHSLMLSGHKRTRAHCFSAKA